ncbi:hypothetical protein S40285_06327 [Stachybotrys chlorohalonatus IBT 40285]|uniref:SnoaL-like domain-containing protein n=1 Tax=Stachybotrys chlorohalonatus (strain IBT 40285) TaxID=1283841 RepID=A0A084QA02_STAC4|nr:hypothetical protein S40285_06327 [Stachybotrys chlorohalonata IBT 40285]
MAPLGHAETFAHLRELYGQYYPADVEAKRSFYSAECAQICRSDPTYAAQNSHGIVAYLYDSGERFKDLISTLPTKKSFYTVRPLTDEESLDFGTEEHVRPAGFASVKELRDQALREEWLGQRVDLWDDDGQGTGLLVKVQYWWRLEDSKDGARGQVWKQILHDILYLGRVDGTEGSEGELVSGR